MLVKKILDSLFRIISRFFVFVIKLKARFRKNQATKTIKKKVAALPYYPENWPGGHDRIAQWKDLFEQDNITYDVCWASNDIELFKYYFSENDFKRYFLFFLCLTRRVKLFFKLLEYDAIWIQRAFIPYYPYQKSYFEVLLAKFHSNVTIDFYDADYLSNYDLTMQSISSFNKVSVSTDFLKNKFLGINDKTFLLNMTVDSSGLKVKTSYKTNQIRIGWMGNPSNIMYIQLIKKPLQELSEKYDNVSFHFLCRELPPLEIKNLHTYNWEDDKFNYQEWLKTIDIGIIPYIGNSDRLKAKSAMKTLEFMACGIPIVTTEHGMFKGMKNGEHYLLAKENNDWTDHISTLVQKEDLRKKIGESGLNFFNNNHTYNSNYDNLKHILLEIH